MKAFARQNNLAAHARTHTCERPYACRQCPHRSAKRAEGHVFDDDDAPAVSSVARGSDEETAEPAAIDDKDTGNPDSEHPLGVLNGAAATASDAAFTKLAAGDETGGPKLTEEEETEEEEHDENDDENDENAAADTPVEPVVKKARKGRRKAGGARHMVGKGTGKGRADGGWERD